MRNVGRTVLTVLERCLTTAAYGSKDLGSGPSNIAPEKCIHHYTIIITQ